MSTSSVGSQQEAVPGGPPASAALQAVVPVMSSKQKPRQSGLPLSAAAMAPHCGRLACIM